ncbi:transposable element Tcb1 transposase [Trichonephila clavipes]|nr:transposable element Tcb1 transposase [Trichonephila clavipes]
MCFTLGIPGLKAGLRFFHDVFEPEEEMHLYSFTITHLSATPRWPDLSLEIPWREDVEQLRHTPGIMVWGGIGYHSHTPLVRIAGTLNSQRYISEVLESVVLPYLQGLATVIFPTTHPKSL